MSIRLLTGWSQVGARYQEASGGPWLYKELCHPPSGGLPRGSPVSEALRVVVVMMVVSPCVHL